MEELDAKSLAHVRGSLANRLSLADKEDYTKERFNIQPEFSFQDVTDFLDEFHCSDRSSKRHVMMAWLLLCSIEGYRVTRFDASKVGCTCWNTTVSDIGNKEGIRVQRRSTRRKTCFSDSTNCSEYWLTEDVIPHVEKWLGGYRQEAA